jgi:hypothetical protein
MKKSILGGLAAGAVALGLAVAGPATASPYSDNALTYLQMMNNDGIKVLDAAQAIRFAGWTCSEMASGYTVYQVRDLAWANNGPANGMTRQTWLDEVEDAAIVFCPKTWHDQVDGPSQDGGETA